MSIKIASGLRDRRTAAALLRDLLPFRVDVVEIQETHFICNVDARVLPGNVYLTYLATGQRGFFVG